MENGPENANILLAFEDSFDGPILEIPEDLLEELSRMDPMEREKRLSVLAEDRQRKLSQVSVKSNNNTGGAFKHETTKINRQLQSQPMEEPPLSGRVAAALKLFTGKSVPSLPNFLCFGVPFPVNKKAGGDTTPKYADRQETALITKQLPAVPIAPHNAESSLDGVPMEEDQVDRLFLDVDDSTYYQCIDPKVTAAALVAKQEVQINELEKSIWLADIEEIKIASTPAKDVTNSIVSRPQEWSAVSQKMNLSCQLTPVVPGRRSCIMWVPKLKHLKPKKKIDQYEISDKDTDSENELSPNSRAKKHVPSWCTGWRLKAISQIALDPESIFGLSVPKCDLDIIFSEANYKQMGLHRPARVRGSSGNWAFDKLTQEEIDRYRAKCGQIVKAEGVFVEQMVELIASI